MGWQAHVWKTRVSFRFLCRESEAWESMSTKKTRRRRSPSAKKTKKDDMSSWVMEDFFLIDTLDGRNPAPVDMVNIPLFTGFYTSQVVSRISEPSTVQQLLSFLKIFFRPLKVGSCYHSPDDDWLMI